VDKDSLLNNIKHYLFNSISTRLLFGVTIITLLTFAATSVFILTMYRKNQFDRFDESIYQQSLFFQTHSDIERDISFEIDTDKVMTADFTGSQPSSYFLLYDKTSEEILLASPELEVIVDDLNDYNTYQSQQGVFVSREIDGNSVRLNIRDYVLIQDNDVVEEGKVPAEKSVRIVIAKKTETITSEFSFLLSMVIAAYSVGAVILILLVNRTISSGLIPLIDINTQVKSISLSHLEPVRMPGIKELDSIVDTLNTVLQKLKHEYDKEKQFTSNVAHELRTPLSELRTLTEVVLTYQKNLTEDDQKNYQEILESTLYLQRVVTSLLFIARSDVNNQITNVTWFSLKHVIDTSISKFQKQADRKSIIINNTINEKMTIHSDSELFSLIVFNLVGNAVFYSPSNTVVTIESIEDEIQFININTDLVQQDIPFLFDRFWRKSKNRTTDENHSGLGLSLAKSLCNDLGLEITAKITGETIIFSIRNLDVTVKG
jgi:signal transduction histidine kinase